MGFVGNRSIPFYHSSSILHASLHFFMLGICLQGMNPILRMHPLPPISQFPPCYGVGLIKSIVTMDQGLDGVSVSSNSPRGFPQSCFTHQTSSRYSKIFGNQFPDTWPPELSA